MRTVIADILAAWRRAERLREELPAGSLDRESAEVAAADLRILYHRLTDEDPRTDPADDEVREAIERAGSPG